MAYHHNLALARSVQRAARPVDGECWPYTLAARDVAGALIGEYIVARNAGEDDAALAQRRRDILAQR